MLDRFKLLAIALPLALGGCASYQTGDGSTGVAFGTSANYHIGGGAPGSCGPAIAEFQAVMDNDQKSGNVNQSVYRKVVADLDGVKAACAAGRTAEANNRLVAIKARYGYR